MSEERIRVGEAITLEMLHGTVGLLRCLTDKNISPGSVEWSCAVVIDNNKKCHIKILNGSRGPTLTEVRQLKNYFKSQGCHGEWHRYKNGRTPKKVIVK